MGTTPSYQQLVAGQVPTVEILADACEYIESYLQQMHSSGMIASAVIYGSVPRGDHTRTSDIDILVRYVTLEALTSLRTLRKELFDRYQGSVADFCPIFDEFAPTPFHRAGASFFNHLSANLEDKIVIGLDPGKSPIEGIWSPKHKVEPIYWNASEIGYYFDGIARKFIRHDTEEKYVDFIKSLRERYKHIVREAVQLARKGELPEKDGRKVDDTSGLMAYFREDFKDEPHILVSLNVLHTADKKLTEYINRAAEAAKVDEQQYRHELDKINELFPEFMQFCINVSRVLLEKHF
jgi:predicted nucleotidyltransferase